MLLESLQELMVVPQRARRPCHFSRSQRRAHDVLRWTVGLIMPHTNAEIHTVNSETRTHFLMIFHAEKRVEIEMESSLDYDQTDTER